MLKKHMNEIHVAEKKIGTMRMMSPIFAKWISLYHVCIDSIEDLYIVVAVAGGAVSTRYI